MTIKKLPIMPITTNEITHPLLGTSEFRNWTLGEHQNVLMKNSDNKDPSIILKTILKNCITKCLDPKGKNIDPTDMPLQLAELSFIKIREISVSDKQDYLIECKGKIEEEPCTEKVRVTADLTKSALQVPEGYKPIITVGSFGIKVKLPSLSFLNRTAAELDGHSIDFISDEIEYITQGEEVWVFSNYTSEQRKEFVKTLPPNFIMEFVRNYQILPRVETPIEGCCKVCGRTFTDKIIGVNQLFTG